MIHPTICCAGATPAAEYAASRLEQLGFSVVHSPIPSAECLLLDVPSFHPDGSLRSGGNIEDLLSRVGKHTIIIGGNLRHPALRDYQTIDLLQDEAYLCQNAAITAHCALQIAAPLLPTTFHKIPVLVIGWGRIGKCLAHLLKAAEGVVTIAARKHTDRCMAQALGFNVVDTGQLDTILPKFRLVYNTVPEILLTKEQTLPCKNTVMIDLASKAGILGGNVLWARGLPGIHAPECSGNLIAESTQRLLKEVTQ